MALYFEVVAITLELTTKHECEHFYEDYGAMIAASNDVSQEQPTRTAAVAPAAPVERRLAPRQPFPFAQVVSPIDDDQGEAASRDEVRCHDISASGMSFWTSRAPQSPHVLIDLNVGPESATVVAEVRHRTELTCLQSALYLVGCRIVARLKDRN
jgi:hypothetical protein